MAPGTASVDHDRATSRRLVPSTPARVPRPRRLPSSPCLCVCLSLSLGRGASQVPQMPAAIFDLLSPCPLPVSFPTATAHGAENVAKLQLGKFRSQPSVASRTNGRWESLNHEHRHSPISATRLWPVTR